MLSELNPQSFLYQDPSLAQYMWEFMDGLTDSEWAQVQLSGPHDSQLAVRWQSEQRGELTRLTMTLPSEGRTTLNLRGLAEDIRNEAVVNRFEFVRGVAGLGEERAQVVFGKGEPSYSFTDQLADQVLTGIRARVALLDALQTVVISEAQVQRVMAENERRFVAAQTQRPGRAKQFRARVLGK